MSSEKNSEQRQPGEASGYYPPLSSDDPPPVYSPPGAPTPSAPSASEAPDASATKPSHMGAPKPPEPWAQRQQAPLIVTTVQQIDHLVQQQRQRQPAEPVSIVVLKLGTEPSPYYCLNCQKNVTTKIEEKLGALNWISSGICCVVCPILFCVPCCIAPCMDIEHTCPQCGQYLGIYKRLAR